MTRTRLDEEVTTRFRDWVEDEYGQRGRFSLLEKESEIPAQRWKNVFYKRQFVTPEMLDFVHKRYPEGHKWILTGMRPAQGIHGFDRVPSLHEQQSLTNRLVWAIKDFAAPRGAGLFSYLESRWRGAATADEWAAVILGQQEASAAMIECICKQRPHLALWITTGNTYAKRNINPTGKDQSSTSDGSPFEDEENGSRGPGENDH